MDQLGRSGDVWCWRQSGKHILALRFSGFDPQRTFVRSSRYPRRKIKNGELKNWKLAPSTGQGFVIGGVKRDAGHS
jgi:hypothetical protein